MGSRTLKLTLAYDGSAFHGWQVQPGKPTIQGVLAGAIESLTGEKLLPQGSGRTDAGVHALAQVATFQTVSSIPVANFRIVLNDRLPAAIRILAVDEVPEGFHARHSARAKCYHYRIWRADVVPPFLARYVTHHPYPLNETAMQQAAALVVGEHDFTSFAAVDPDRTIRLQRPPAPAAGAAPLAAYPPEPAPAAGAVPLAAYPPEPAPAAGAVPLAAYPPEPAPAAGAVPLATYPPEPAPAAGAVPLAAYPPERRPMPRNPLQGLAEPSTSESSTALLHTTNVRTIHESRFERHAEELVYIVRGNGFLHHMVRNLVGTFILAGKGSIAPADILAILAAQDRRAAGPTAPAEGLYLVEVQY